MMRIRISDEELANLIKLDESVFFEFKGTLSRDVKERLSTYFAAFANTEGGLFVIGISNSKETIGYTLKKGDREYISEQAKNCRPQVHIEIEERDYDGHKIVLIKVPKSYNKIHIDNKKRFLIRVGPNLDYLDITGLIPLLKERISLDYKTSKPEIPSLFDMPSSEGNEVKTKASSEEIDLCLKSFTEATKESRLEGLRELELLLYKRDIFDNLNVFEEFKKLLIDKEEEIRRKSLHVLIIMLRVVEREESQNEESQKKLIDTYKPCVTKLAESDQATQVRSDAIQTLLEMGDDRVIETIIKIILSENDEIYK